MPAGLLVIGILYTIVPLAVLATSAFAFASLRRSGNLGAPYRRTHGPKDAVFLLAYVTALAGGVGILAGQPWGRAVAEGVSWAMLALVLAYGALRVWAWVTVASEMRMPLRSGVIGNWLGGLIVVALLGSAIGYLRAYAPAASADVTREAEEPRMR